jgi:ferredoxin
VRGLRVDLPVLGPGLDRERDPFAGKAQVNPALCKGCGLCVASCRSGAIHLKGFDNDQIFAKSSTSAKLSEGDL